MRDLNVEELEFVYGAGGRGCSPRPPSCRGGKGSKGSRGKGSNKRSKKRSKSKGKGSRGC